MNSQDDEVLPAKKRKIAVTKALRQRIQRWHRRAITEMPAKGPTQSQAAEVTREFERQETN